MSAVIEAEKLSKVYRGGRGIHEVDLMVEPGEIFGFLGPNGAGKTTTIRTLMDFMRPTGGRARIFGLDSHRDSVAIRRRLGNLPDEPALDDRLTGEQLLRLMSAIRGIEDLSLARNLQERLDADMTTRIRHLSRGNKQKIGLIQAMFHDPELVIFDEPTAGLDPIMQEVFLDLMKEHRLAGKTAFISSHVLSEVEQVCDRVGIVRDGRLVAIESVEALLHRSIRRVTLTLEGPAAAAPFEAIKGVERVAVEGKTITFTVRENLDAVVKAASRFSIVDLEVEHPTLEEVFLRFYGDETVEPSGETRG